MIYNEKDRRLAEERFPGAYDLLLKGDYAAIEALIGPVVITHGSGDGNPQKSKSERIRAGTVRPDPETPEDATYRVLRRVTFEEMQQILFNEKTPSLRKVSDDVFNNNGWTRGGIYDGSQCEEGRTSIGKQVTPWYDSMTVTSMPKPKFRVSLGDYHYHSVYGVGRVEYCADQRVSIRYDKVYVSLPIMLFEPISNEEAIIYKLKGNR